MSEYLLGVPQTLRHANLLPLGNDLGTAADQLVHIYPCLHLATSWEMHRTHRYTEVVGLRTLQSPDGRGAHCSKHLRSRWEKRRDRLQRLVFLLGLLRIFRQLLQRPLPSLDVAHVLGESMTATYKGFRSRRLHERQRPQGSDVNLRIVADRTRIYGRWHSYYADGLQNVNV